MTRTISTTGAIWLWVAFLAVNVTISCLALTGQGRPLGDVYLYQWWIEQGAGGGPWVGFDEPWVYPVLALLPMTIAFVGGAQGYVVTWLALVVLLNCAALAVVLGASSPAHRSRALRVGWWWTAFLLLLGPIAVGRIDSITVPIAIIALCLLAKRPFIAGVLLAVATWIKVWPAAVIAAIVVASRSRWSVVAGGAVVTALIVVATILLGGGEVLLSFITQQTDRGLQIEAPVSAPWLWAGALGAQEAGLYYDDDLLTYQVFGPGAEVVAQIMTAILAVAVASIVLLAVWLQGRGAKQEALLPPLILAFVVAFIAVNKVGSPQFIAWLAVPIIFGLVGAASARAFRVPAAIALAIAGLTHFVYPYLYGYLLDLEVFMVAVLTLRNALLFVLLAWAITAMVKTPRQRRS
ncbi:glycosyltransferase family 87 protein [Homoserinimonas hongtaonis]|uniref:glycosyltransferase family 87 protein n=1 Tax=Homoserinimonas hongtaonis TaxID=2079791 RepID=UPI000D33E065|nr:glycosyltransferase family 87 protein [Salinibacterium hongtaonis]AWB88782.1 hypothetical protein C2138_03780 [Salinibacterium hongtaonis]